MPVSQHLLAEADRQLSDQRAQADAFATRSGLLIATTAILTGVLSGIFSDHDQVPPSMLWILGGGAVAGVLVQCMSRVSSGPTTMQVSLWVNQATPVDDQMLGAKLMAIDANARSLGRAEVIF